jgi:hypothetical protein
VRRFEGFAPASAVGSERRFKMAFAVNNDVALPARVIMIGAIDGDGFEKSLKYARTKLRPSSGPPTVHSSVA